MRTARFWAYLLLLFLCASFVPVAHAQQQPPPGCGSAEKPSTQCTQEDAYRDCEVFGQYTLSRRSNAVGSRCRLVSGTSGGATGRYQCEWGTTAGSYPTLCDGQHQFSWAQSCPSGTAWNGTTKRCEAVCPTGEWVDPTNPRQCLSQSKCLSRNASLGDAPRTHTSDVSCVAGCRYALDSSQGAVRTTGPGGVKLFAGVWRYTGDQCGAEPPPPPDDEPDDPPKPQQCVPVDGQTLCIKPDGQHCYSASTGRQICWKPGETGDKPDGDTLQRRVAGPSEIPPNLNLPNGDTLTRSGNPITTTTTTSTTTITTTTTNYRTQHGTNAGNTNSGENANGTDDGEPDGEGDNGVAGDGCDKPPTCTLGESIGCAILMQTWKNDCTLRTAIAPNESDEPSDLSGLDGFEQAKQNLFDAEGEGAPGLDDIDSGGWAPSGSCPIAFSFTFWGRSYNLNDSRLCEVLDALAALVLVLGGIHSAYIFASGSRK